ncbi:MarR family transcriptional regulator [Micromonospora sp. KC606]|uniref:MarR family winged helix-turn-helix transcriptional regulator n=1 Tax=Micromonospora sp. KC606 TaxID=2530379 RepID=UPI00104D265F|nr:MarR family winged helix-turn-helix transcriptional regulator [Micromonospora sp. KC606]TDC85969.1 MarR family transcriptional regulator [Micromonospora sp. KC606]
MERSGRGDPMNRLSLLLAKRGSLTDARLRIALSANGLTPRHAMVLSYLESEPACQQMLVDLLECDPSVLVAILNELERAELTYRRRDPSDRRRHIVEITPHGRRALKTVETTFAEVEDELFGDLSEAERATLRELLSRVAPGLGECPRIGLKAKLQVMR